MSGAAQLMGFGEESTLIAGALAGELMGRLNLADCQFELGLLPGDQPYVALDGSLVNVDGRRPTGRLAAVDLRLVR